MEITSQISDKIDSLFNSKSQSIVREVTYEHEYSGKFSTYIAISPKDLAEIKRIKAEGSEDFDIEISKKFRYFDTGIEYSYLSDIDTETPYYPCTFTVADFPDGINQAPSITPCQVILSHEQYVKLLKWRINVGKTGFDSLIFSDKQLYYYIRQWLSERIYCNPTTPALVIPSFAIEDSQILAETDEILKGIV